MKGLGSYNFDSLNFYKLSRLVWCLHEGIRPAISPTFNHGRSPNHAMAHILVDNLSPPNALIIFIKAHVYHYVLYYFQILHLILCKTIFTYWLLGSWITFFIISTIHYHLKFFVLHFTTSKSIRWAFHWWGIFLEANNMLLPKKSGISIFLIHVLFTFCFVLRLLLCLFAYVFL